MSHCGLSFKKYAIFFESADVRYILCPAFIADMLVCASGSPGEKLAEKARHFWGYGINPKKGGPANGKVLAAQHD
jgi:hypothetical protein